MLLYYILIPFAWLLWHIGFRIRVEGRENLKKVQTQGYILAPTHVSAIDPVFIVITRWGRRMVVFAKKELFEINAFLTRKGRQTSAPQERTVRHCRRGGGGRGALPHPVRHPGRENAPVLQGAGDLR